jgi:hypothetical protein
MILNVYESSKRIIFTNKDCSIYIDTKREALILFLKTETFSSQTIYFVSWTLFSTLFGILVFETKTICQKIIVELFLLLCGILFYIVKSSDFPNHFIISCKL